MIRFECKRLIGCCGVFSAAKAQQLGRRHMGQQHRQIAKRRPANAVGGRLRLRLQIRRRRVKQAWSACPETVFPRAIEPGASALRAVRLRQMPSISF